MIEILRGGDIQAVLRLQHRQYLVGDLKQPQLLEHIRDDQVEMGMTRYEAFKCEAPHDHPLVTEYQIVLKGCAKYVDLAENRELLVDEGDVFVIRPHTPYIQKSPPGTVILFFKHPCGNDKRLIPMTEAMKAWAASWEASWTVERSGQI